MKDFLSYLGVIKPVMESTQKCHYECVDVISVPSEIPTGAYKTISHCSSQVCESVEQFAGHRLANLSELGLDNLGKHFEPHVELIGNSVSTLQSWGRYIGETTGLLKRPVDLSELITQSGVCHIEIEDNDSNYWLYGAVAVGASALLIGTYLVYRYQRNKVKNAMTDQESSTDIDVDPTVLETAKPEDQEGQLEENLYTKELFEIEEQASQPDENQQPNWNSDWSFNMTGAKHFGLRKRIASSKRQQ